MRRPWFKNQPVDESFYTAAPLLLRESFDISQPAAAVWDELTADNPLAWCRIVHGIEWTSPRPFGVGTTRTVRSLLGANAFREHFFIWEEGRRHAFYVVEASDLMFASFAEDYLVEPTGDDACRFTWTVAARTRRPARFLDPLNRRLLGTLFTDTRKHFANSGSH